jgi:hypothetical protein
MTLSEPITDWAFAVATRISDEWDGSKHFPFDAEILKNLIEQTLNENPKILRSLIGTGIIEEDYFESLD